VHSCRVNLKGKKGKQFKNRIFGGYVISTAPKFGEMLVGLSVDLLAKRGPLKALQLALRQGQKIRFFRFFSFLGIDPQTGSKVEN